MRSPEQEASGAPAQGESLEELYQDVLGCLQSTVEALSGQIRTAEELLQSLHRLGSEREQYSRYARANLTPVILAMLDGDDGLWDMQEEVRELVAVAARGKAGKFHIPTQEGPTEIGSLFKLVKKSIQQVGDHASRILAPAIQAARSSVDRHRQVGSEHREYHFSPCFCDAAVALNTPFVAQRAKAAEEGFAGYALIEPQISPAQNSKVRLKILSGQRFVGVGVCEKELFDRRAQINENACELGDKHLLESRAFKEGEDITVEFSPSTGQLTYHNHQQSTVQSFQVASRGKEMHFSVELRDLGDSVMIVE